MASKDDDNTPVSSPIPGPPQHETPIVSVQPPTPLVHPPPSPTISKTIAPPSTAPPSMPLPQSQNPDPTRIAEQKQQSSWYPSTPYPRRRSLDLDHQGVLSPITPFISTRSPSGPPDTPIDYAGENENPNANSQVSPERKTVQFQSTLPSAHPTSTASEQNRQSSWFPSTPDPYRFGMPDLDELEETQRRSITSFIPPLSSPSGPSFHNSGWSPLHYQAPGPPVNNTIPHTQSYAGAATRIPYYGDGVRPSATPAGYPGLRLRANYPDWMAPGTALRYDGVHNAGAEWGFQHTPWVGMAMATRDDEAATSTYYPVTSPTSTHPTTTTSTPTHPTTNPTSMRPTTTSTSMHPITNPSWAVHVYSQTLHITGERLRRYQIVRSKLRFESQLNDLFSGSLGLWLRCFSFEGITGLTVHT